jgi:hypothetical protein
MFLKCLLTMQWEIDLLLICLFVLVSFIINTYLDRFKVPNILICNLAANFASVIIWFIVILIFHPKPGAGVGPNSTQQNSGYVFSNPAASMANNSRAVNTQSMGIAVTSNAGREDYIPYSPSLAKATPVAAASASSLPPRYGSPPPLQPKSTQRPMSPPSPTYRAASPHKNIHDIYSSEPMATEAGVDFYPVVSRKYSDAYKQSRANRNMGQEEIALQQWDDDTLRGEYDGRSQSPYRQTDENWLRQSPLKQNPYSRSSDSP